MCSFLSLSYLKLAKRYKYQSKQRYNMYYYYYILLVCFVYVVLINVCISLFQSNIQRFINVQQTTLYTFICCWFMIFK